jgi:hypothetical protein
MNGKQDESGDYATKNKDAKNGGDCSGYRAWVRVAMNVDFARHAHPS